MGRRWYHATGCHHIVLHFFLHGQVPEAEAKKRKRPKAPVGLGQLAAKKKKSSKGISGMIDKWQAVRKEEVHPPHQASPL